MPVAVSAADTRPSVYAGEGDGIVLDGIREDSYGEPVEVSKAGVAHNADMPLTTAKLSVAWEGDTIYYYIEVNDITPNAKSSNFWQCDGVEFVVDLLDAKPLTYPDDGTVARFAILAAVDDTNPYFLNPYMLDRVTDDQIEWYFTPADEWEANGGYVLECSFKSPVTLKKGMKMGFDVQIYDDQNGQGNRDSQTYLADTSDTFHYCPANLGACLVLGTAADVADDADDFKEAVDDRVAIPTGYGECVLDGERDPFYGDFAKIEKAGIAHGEGNPLTTADICFSWYGDKIYAYAEVADTTPNAVSGNFWCCDGLELVFDLYDARANTYPGDNNVARFAVLPLNTAESAYASNYFLPNADESQIKYFYKATDTGYVLEVEYTVPAAASGCLKGGNSVGFDAQIYDDQKGEGNRDSQTFFGNTEDIIGSYPSVFGGKLILAAAGEEAVNAGAPAVKTAPQTYDAAAVAVIMSVISLAGYAISKKH